MITREYHYHVEGYKYGSQAKWADGSVITKSWRRYDIARIREIVRRNVADAFPEGYEICIKSLTRLS